MDLWRLSATDLAARIRLREVSAREAAQSALARLAAVNPRLNAVVDHRPDDVLAQADAIDAAIARDEHVGPLAGVPVTVKINTDQAGTATSNGLKAQRDLVAEHDSPVVANLRKAGAVLLGRTNTPTLSLRWFTSNGLFGATKNPRDPSLTPGGSSGGAGAAVASGIGAIAHGTDIAGSIRYPAYACGVHGLRPTFGRIPTCNASGPDRGIGAQLTAVSGPLARTIGDLKRALAAMAAGSARDPWWVPAPLDGPPYTRRVALCTRPDGLATAPAIEAALRSAADILARAGWQVEEIATPPLAQPAELQVRLWLGQGFASLAETVEQDGDPGALAIVDAFRETVRTLAPDAVLDALTRRAGYVRAWATFLETTPLVLLPVSAELPFVDGLDLEGPDTVHRIFAANMPQVALPLLGLPALTVTTGAVGRTPVGVQLVAGRFREDVLLAAGAAIEAALPPITIAEPV